jgi:hypothetical protein
MRCEGVHAILRWKKIIVEIKKVPRHKPPLAKLTLNHHPYINRLRQMGTGW